MNISLKLAMSGFLVVMLIAGIRGCATLAVFLGSQPDDAVFWVRSADGWVLIAASCVVVFPVLLWHTGKTVPLTLAMGAVLAALSICLLIPGNRGAYGLTADAVILRPGLPWRRDTRFAINAANLRSRGCQDRGRLRPGYSVEYLLIAPAESREAVVDLGEGVNRSNIKLWLAAMRSQPFVMTNEKASYVSTLSNQSETRACVKDMGRDLTADEQNSLIALLTG